MKGVVLMTSALLLCAAGAARGEGIINPHQGEHCRSCHLKLPEKGPGTDADFHFLAGEIDPTCLICHSEQCCSIGEKHRTHPSNIDGWDKEKYGAPRSLPLSNGYITCATCHFWRREMNPRLRDYKLVRLVEITGTRVEWTELCQDCHRDY